MSMLVSRRSFVAAATTLALPYVWVKRAEAWADYVHQPWRQFPFTCIGRVYLDWNMPKSRCGTGVMIKNRIVLTCAHLCYSDVPGLRGRYPPSGAFEPAANTTGSMKKFQVQTAFVPPVWFEEANKSRSDRDYRKMVANDWALLVLYESPNVGFLGLDSIGDNYPKSVSHAGYPGIGRGNMWYHEVDIKVEGDLLISQGMEHGIYSGMSGSPFFYAYKKDDYHVCGIHSRGGDNSSEHARVTDELASKARELTKEYP
ncbi:MAG: hypothetical protein PHF35_05200 [Candidatus Moranbacteria bacterium]|nr:hypothetical protein [Candidatus Moranbacteria bacterium]